MDDAPVRAQAEAIVIENVAVVDVVKGRLTAPQTVIIAEGRIASMGRLETAAPPDAVRVDGSGRYLMPGLVDMHVHLFNNATHRPPNDWAFPLWVANGVTGVRDMRSELSDLPTIARWRDAVGRHQLIAPRVLAAGLAPNTGSEETARQAVQDAHAAGADFIKIFSNVSESLWHTILEKARDVNLPVCGHVPAEVSARTAASAGQRSNEHLTQVYEACSRKEQEFLAKRRGLNGNEAARIRDEQEGEVLAAFDEKVCTQTAEHLAKTRQVQVPTLVLPWVEAQPRRKSFRDDPHWNLLRADEQARWEGIIEQEPAEITETARRRWEVSREIVRIMERAEVRILAGTDSPMPLVYPGWAVHKELELLVESGLSAAEALRSATIWPAEFLNVNQSRGSIAVGKDADLVLLDADPLREIGNTRLIHAVVLEGRLLLRADLDALLRGK
jgi:imidazolonepropionase-like amidohydrolase